MDLRYPVGKFVLDRDVTPEKRRAWIAELDALPRNMRKAIAELPAAKIDTPYRDGGWTARQVVHHVADSHLNAYTRIKLALTEDSPTIKPYQEALWAELPDGKAADPEISLGILDGVHQRLTMVLQSLEPAQFERPALHPESGPTSVDGLLQMYAWHCRHHLAHVGIVAAKTKPSVQTDRSVPARVARPFGRSNPRGVPIIQAPDHEETPMIAAILSAALVALMGAPATGRQAEPAAVTARGEWTADLRQSWSNDGEPHVQLSLRAGDENWGFGLRPSELDGLPPAAQSGVASDVRFTLTREAGVFRMQGSFDRGRGNGTFTFAASPAFVTSMGTLGYRSLSADNLMRLAVTDVTAGYVRGLADAGYRSLELDSLVRMRIHRVTPEMIRDLGSLGYRGLLSDDLVRMRIHGATPEFVRAMQAAGYSGLSVEDLVRFRIHKVTPEFIKAMADLGYRPVDREQIVRFRIHKVTPEFVQALAARGYRNVDGEDLVKMKIHNVSAGDIDEYKTLGYAGVDTDELVKMRIHRVTPAFIRDIHAAGFQTISLEQLVKMRIHRVDAQFIKDLKADGYQNLTASDVIDIAIRGPRFARVRRP